MPKGIYDRKKARGRRSRVASRPPADTEHSTPEPLPPDDSVQETYCVMDIQTEDAPEPVIKVGDVFRATSDAFVVVTAIEPQFGLTHGYYCDSLWPIKNVAWEDLHKAARALATSTCEHHVAVGNWKFVRSVADLWAK